jgi:hypothetical protein
LQLQIKTNAINGFALGSVSAVLACAYAAAFFLGVYAVRFFFFFGFWG